jgi:SAM-dependent methyltransferase
MTMADDVTIDSSPAARRWADGLAAWAVPEHILASAPESPHRFDVGLFARIADEALERVTPSQRIAGEGLPAGGSVLDVGCGGGAGSLPLAPAAALLVGVDESPGMLTAFAERAEAQGVAHAEVEGSWPDAADRAPVTDVVVCHNVLYNVPDLLPFIARLDDHARSRVVVELTAHHPLSWMNPYWRELHGIERPEVPTAQDAAAVARDGGYDVQVERWDRPMHSDRTPDELVAFIRQRLCLGPDRDEEIRALTSRFPPPQTRPVHTIWWPDRRH